MSTSAPSAKAGAAPLSITRHYFRAIQGGGIALLALLLLGLWQHPSIGLFATWYILFALLPLGIVLAGYATWRRVCPLALVSQLPRRLGIGGRLRMSPKWQSRSVFLQLGLFILLVALRYVFFESSAEGSLFMLAGLFGMALVAGLVFTGKTWCNHFCPMSFVERIYSGPRMFGRGRDSKCATCSACKKHCPDIDLEASYWREQLTPSRRATTYMFVGVVAGFFGLQSFGDAFYANLAGTLPGFLGPARGLMAAALILVASALLGYSVFELANRLMERPGGRGSGAVSAMSAHPFALAAAFLAFNLYYGFVADRWFDDEPLLGRLAWLLISAVSGVYLWRVLHRSETDYLRERIALKMLAEANIAAPGERDLHEIYFREMLGKEREALFRTAYTKALAESFSDGVLEPDEERILETLRRELGVPEDVHRAALTNAAKSVQAATGMAPHSQEKNLQLVSYRMALEAAIVDRHITDAESRMLVALRRQFGITSQEQAFMARQIIERLATTLPQKPGSQDSPQL